MSEKFTLEVSHRDVVGKKVKRLRQQGFVPGVIYGRDFETTHIALEHKPLRQVLLQAGGTQLIELDFGSESLTTLAREVQRDPIHGDILHVDFYRVAMDRVIRTSVPLVMIGENPMIGRDALLHHHLNVIEVESLPGNIPPHIDVDITRLTEIGQSLLVNDLDMPKGVLVLTHGDEIVVKLDHAQTAAQLEEEVDAQLAEASADVERVTKRAKEEVEE
jgi:large subunit ribosomal protein L25